jgi:DNA-binding NarL/FixJ family response regulator
MSSSYPRCSFARFIAEVQPPPRHVARLTPRQTEVFNLKYAGYGNKAIARQLNVAVGTVGTLMRSVYNRLRAAHNTEAVDTAAWFDSR